MSDWDSFRQLIPSLYKARVPQQSFHEQIIVNWLDQELDPDAPKRMPILNDLSGWRNKEVYYYVTYEHPDWTVLACR
jgi:hypothetical protein